MMENYMAKSIETANAPQAIGPYSQAISVGPMVFISGQLPIDPLSGEMPVGIEAQAHQALRNLGAVLTASESDFSSVAKTTVFLTSIEDFPTINRIYAEYFNEGRPARSTVEVARLPQNARIEIDAIGFQVRA